MKELGTSKRKTCQIKKALYGLCQPRYQWYKHLDNKLKQIGLKQLKADSWIYISNNKENTTILAIYVNNNILIEINNMNR